MSLITFRSIVSNGYRLGRTFPLYQSFRYPSYLCSRLIGEREIVGNGQNSECSYIDSTLFPFPAIRFQEMTPEFSACREKEKGDWRNLTMGEKKTLYRASFCQTYAEMRANSGQWKSIIGISLMWISVGVWLDLFIIWITDEELPESFSEESQKAQLKRMIDLEMNPITGLASKWDYENCKWK